MTFILRSIKRNRWIKDDEATALLTSGDIPSDSLADLNTMDQKLSVWEIQADYSNLDHVITAIASTRHRADTFTYILIEIQKLKEHRFEFDNTEGGTAFTEANKWHLDLIKLTGNKLISLSGELFLNGRIHTKTKRDIIKLLNQACDEKKLPEEKRELCIK